MPSAHCTEHPGRGLKSQHSVAVARTRPLATRSTQAGPTGYRQTDAVIVFCERALLSLARSPRPVEMKRPCRSRVLYVFFLRRSFHMLNDFSPGPLSW
jgi:hypothetical protein